MKPMFFKTQQDLMNFLQNCPTPEGRAKVQGIEMEAAPILQRCVALVPEIFEYRKVLAKGAGGIGSSKAVMRYAEVASDAVSQSKMEAFDRAVEDISRETELLLEAGGGDELAAKLSSARTQVAYFTLVKESIEGFRDKLNKYMARVEETYADLVSRLEAQKSEIQKLLQSEAAGHLMKEVSDKHKAVQGLVSAMNEYCALQVAYNGILLGSR